MQTLHERYPRLVVLLVDTEEPAAIVGPHYASKDVTFTVALDTSGEVSDLYRVRAIPTLFFIDSAGVLQKIYVGQPTPAQLDEALASVGLE